MIASTTIWWVVAVSTGISSRSAPASSAWSAERRPAARGAHAERVGDRHALEAEVVAQEVVDLGRHAGRHAGSDGGEVEVAQHHRGGPVGDGGLEGRRSCASISASVESTTGDVSWLSLTAVPCPGKCFTVGTIAASS